MRSFQAITNYINTDPNMREKKTIKPTQKTCYTEIMKGQSNIRNTRVVQNNRQLY